MSSASAPTKAPRIPAIDFWRGACLLMIFIDHIPANPLSHVTLRSWGYADAAEVFIFLAGFSAMQSLGRSFAAGNPAEGLLRVAVRTWQLYRAHLLLVFAIVLTVAAYGLFADDASFAERFNLTPLFAQPQIAILRLATLRYMPNMSDILPVYVLLIALFPAVWFLIRLSPKATFALSAALWLTVNLMNGNLPNYPEGRTWFLNPLAWQFIFVSGALLSVQRERLALWPRSNILFGLCLLVLTVGILSAAPWTSYKPLAAYRLIPLDFSLIDIHKTNLFPARIIHFFALLVVATRLFPTGSRLWATWPARFVSAFGRHALPVYCAGTVLSLATYMLLDLWKPGILGAMIVNAAGIAFLGVMVLVLERTKTALSASTKTAKPQ